MLAHLPTFCFQNSETPQQLSLTRAILPLVTRWLRDTFEESNEDEKAAVIMRETVHSLYCEFSRRSELKVLTPSSLGKIVKITFPKVKIRRLTTAHGSKYHYAGIKLKDLPPQSPTASNDLPDPQPTLSPVVFFDLSLENLPTSNLASTASEPTSHVLQAPPVPEPTLPDLGFHQRFQEYCMQLVPLLATRQFEAALLHTRIFWSHAASIGLYPADGLSISQGSLCNPAGSASTSPSIPRHVSGATLPTVLADPLTPPSWEVFLAPLADALLSRRLVSKSDFSDGFLRGILGFLVSFENVTNQALEQVPAVRQLVIKAVQRRFTDEVRERCFARFAICQILSVLGNQVTAYSIVEALKQLGGNSVHSVGDLPVRLLWLTSTAAMAVSSSVSVENRGNDDVNFLLQTILLPWVDQLIAESAIFHPWSQSRSLHSLQLSVAQWNTASTALAFDLHMHNPISPIYSTVQLLLSWVGTWIMLSLQHDLM